MTYKIEVITTPHIHDSPKKPYFWCIQSCVDGGNWCTYTAGWAITLDEAWKQAHQFYNKYIKDKDNVELKEMFERIRIKEKYELLAKRSEKILKEKYEE